MAEVPVKDKIEYTVALVSDFAKKYSLSTTQAFNYLDRFNAIDFINQHYNVAHTLSFAEILDDMQAESDGIAEAVSMLKNLLGGIEI